MIKVFVALCVAVACLTTFSGILLIIIGSICAVNTGHLQHLWPQIYILSYLSIVVGILAILFAGSVVFCTLNQYASRSAHFAYILLTVVVFAVICAIILIVGRTSLQPTVLDKTVTIFKDYSFENKHPNSNKIVDRVQQSLACCGVRNPTFWTNRSSDGRSVPDSCCFFMIRDCGKDALVTSESTYSTGCVEPIFRYLLKRYQLLIGMNITAAILALVTSAMTICLKIHIRKHYDVM